MGGLEQVPDIGLRSGPGSPDLGLVGPDGVRPTLRTLRRLRARLKGCSGLLLAADDFSLNFGRKGGPFLPNASFPGLRGLESGGSDRGDSRRNKIGRAHV